MTYSLNELHSLISKAVVGAGFPTGHAHAVAAAGIWLARRHRPCCEIVARAISKGVSDRTPKHDGTTGSTSYIFPNAQAAVDSVTVADLIVAAEQESRCTLEQIDEPELLVAILAVAAGQHGVSFALSAKTADLVIEPQSALNPGALRSLVADLAAGRDVAVSKTNATLSHMEDNLATRYDPLAVADSGWDALTTLAAKTYVPATEQSRLKGAGAGLTDND